jgi:hypothetical protein
MRSQPITLCSQLFADGGVGVGGVGVGGVYQGGK